ncbi:MAG: Ig-like domain-containing protein [Lachnospiraceae bacterium]|nr:Ig-like domain-containing protein [Lachnospiraceae bacterium]
MNRKQMRRFAFLQLCLLVCLLTVIPAWKVKAAPAAPVQLKKKLALARYQKVKLIAKNASGTISWSSSDPEVATVTKRGIVRTKTAGKCRIVARAGGKKYVCRLTVKPLAITTESLLMVKGRQMTLTLNSPDVTPAWSSSDRSIASVDESGLVRAIKPGKCLITAVYKKEKMTCRVEVSGATPDNLTASYTADETNSGKIILAGSSSVDFWNSAPQAFAPYPVINMAIAGTVVGQWLTWYQDMIVNYSPSAVVLYVGSNDLPGWGTTTAEQNASNTIRLLKRLKKRLKKTPIFYVGISPCWARKGAWADIATSNRLVREFCSQYANLYYIDIASACAMPDGTPNKALFLDDQLHPSEAGYAVWKRVVAKQVKKVVKKTMKDAGKK